jgi:N-hydroxyarylamine O-acetyltransferase
MTGFDLSAYLDRIDSAPVPVTAAGLRALQQAQLRAIPFESLDPYLGRSPSLRMATIVEKIVHGGRGGYCFELNALFHASLLALGFPARRLLGRVRKGAREGGARSHLLLEVPLDEGLYLADAGYGGPGALVPLRLDSTAEQPAPNGLYRVWSDPLTGERVVDKRLPDGWFPLYSFDDTHVGEMDLEGANYICATWDAMPFVGNLMLAGFDGDTRIGVFNRTVTREGPDGTEKSEIADYPSFAALLRQDLGLRLAEDDLRRVWDKLNAG